MRGASLRNELAEIRNTLALAMNADPEDRENYLRAALGSVSALEGRCSENRSQELSRRDSDV